MAFVLSLLTTSLSASAATAIGASEERAVIIELVGAVDGPIPLLTPDELGTLVFEVRFREFGPLGTPLRDIDAPISAFTFQLLAAEDADPFGPPKRILYEAPPSAIVDKLDGFEVRVPVWDLSHIVGPLRSPVALSAWAVLDHEGTHVEGYYQPAVQSSTGSAELAGLDAVPGAFAVDLASARFGGSLVGLVTERRADRGQLTTLVFDLRNTGSFTETFHLRAEAPSNLFVAFNPGTVGHPTSPTATFVDADITVGADKHASIGVDVIALPHAANGMPNTVYLNVTLSHPVQGGTEMTPLRSQGTSTVGPPTFSVSKVGYADAVIRPGDYGPDKYAVIFKVQNSANSVTDSFAIAPEENAALAWSATNVPATKVLSPGAYERVRLEYKPRVDLAFGSTIAVGVRATPDHGGPSETGVYLARIAADTLTIESAATSMQARPGEFIEQVYTLRFTGPYVESVKIKPTHEIFNSAFEILDANGAALTDGEVVFNGTAGGEVVKTVRVKTRVPADVSFGTVDTTTVAFDTMDARSAVPDLTHQFNIHVVAASIQLERSVDEPAIRYALQGETVRRQFDVTYSGDVPWSFDLAVSGAPFGITPTVSTPRASFPAGSGIRQTISVDLTIPSSANYGALGNLGLMLTPVGTWNAPVPPTVSAPVQIYALALELEFLEDEVRAWPEDVMAPHEARVSLAPLSSGGTVQWAERAQTRIPLTFAFTQTAMEGEGPAAPADGGSGHWADTMIAPTSLAPGETATVWINSTADGSATDRELVVSALSQGLARPLVRETRTTTHVLTREDVTLHQVLVGCYGTSAETCVRREGPVQALTTHDVPTASYSRAYLVQSLIITRGGDPSYLDLAGTGASARVSVIPDPLDPRFADALTHDRMQTSPYAADHDVSIVVAGDQPLAMPGGSLRSGIATLLWETRLGGDLNTQWFLEHLGTALVQGDITIHGLTTSTASYDAAAAVVPLGGARAALPAMFLTDKDDPDGDTVPTNAEITGRSNPALRGSTPASDDDGDCRSNAEDALPLLNEAALLAAAADGLTAAEAQFFASAMADAFFGRGEVRCER